VGYLLLSGGLAGEAAQQLASQAAPEGLESFHAYYLAEARFYSHDRLSAASGFAQAAQAGDGWFKARARARQAEALLATGSTADALELLEKTAPDANGPELYFQRGVARELVGDAAGARSDFRLVAAKFPLHPCASLALERASAHLGGPIQFALDERVSRARAFLDAGVPTQALDELARAERVSPAWSKSDKARLALLRAAALFALARDPQAEAQIKLTLAGPPAQAAEALLLLARHALKMNRDPEARRLIDSLQKRYPKEPAADEAGYLLGWIDLQANQWKRAIASFTSFEKRHPRSRRRDDALWFKSLALILGLDYADARRQLQSLGRLFPTSQLVPQARYWSARSLQLSGGDLSLVLEEYQQLMKLFPGSYYSVLAQSRLRELGKEPPPQFPEPPRSPKVAQSDLGLAQLLSEAGLPRDASLEAERRIERVRGTAEAIQLGHALQQMGEYGRAYALAARLLWGSAYSSKDPDALTLFYPRAYQPTVERLAEEQSIDPYFVWAIMRRESSFRAEATSAANARGLMQVFPPTAVEISKRLALEAPDPNELFSADINIRFAAWYLAQLSARFVHPALCAAAYNAGPGPVNRWLSERGSLPLDLFVERIPFKETRAYVKQVVADYFTYRELYEGQNGKPPLDLALPSSSSAGINF
jgi:soluble lytic murein transglycosylase